MWEKQQTAVQSWPKKLVKQSSTNSSYINVILVQIIICALAAAIFIVCKIFSPSLSDIICSEYKHLLTDGTDYSKQTELIRFANAEIDKIRQSTDAVTSKLAGAGGAYKVSDSKVPDGASLDEYTLKEKIISPLNGAVTSAYGFRDNPVDGENDFHMGIDIAANEGTSVAGVLDGQVYATGFNALRGNYIIVRHKNSCVTLYQHLLYSYVRKGEKVKQGQIIAASGNTGYTTGPHLHFELILNGIRVNPAYALCL